MRPSEMRRELLDQHEKLRLLMDELRATASSAEVGKPLESIMAAGLARLESALVEHNAREESLLAVLIRGVDAWGPARAEIMDQTHDKEHAALRDALHGVRAGPTSFRQLVTLFERLLEHMEREERAFLSEDVLRDDMVVIDPGA